MLRQLTYIRHYSASLGWHAGSSNSNCVSSLVTWNPGSMCAAPEQALLSPPTGEGCLYSTLLLTCFVPADQRLTHTTLKAAALLRLLSGYQVKFPEFLSTYVCCSCFSDQGEICQLLSPVYCSSSFSHPGPFYLQSSPRNTLQITITPGSFSDVLSSSVTFIVMASCTTAMYQTAKHSSSCQTIYGFHGTNQS